jgi:Tfp pilus assembly protein PilW
MLKPQRHITGSLVSSEHGLTIIELLVSIVAGLVVLLALFSVLDVSLRHSTATQDRVQANQIGRVAMTKVVDEMHSACLSPSFTPVMPKSTANEFRFVSAYGSEAVLTKAYEHRIVFTENGKNGTLTDKIAPSNGGSWPKFSFPSNPTSEVKLAENVSAITGVPIFRYYKYASASESSGTLPLNTIDEEKSLFESIELGEKKAAETAAVNFSFHTEATDRNTLNRGVDLSSQVTFSFSVPNSETPIHDAPCQ